MLIVVKIADMKISKSDDILITYALGSCVGICLYDPSTKIGGLSHILLPNDNNFEKKEPYKYANTAIIQMLKQMEQKGANRTLIKAKIAGGAQMFKITGMNNNDINSPFKIGQRNIAMVKSVLSSININIIAEDVGKDYGRTMIFDLSDGSVTIKSIDNGNKKL